MDKLQMAHEMACAMIASNDGYTIGGAMACAWEYADAMQAEWDSRINKDRPDVLSKYDPMRNVRKHTSNAAQENLAEQDAQMYGIGLIRILKKGDQLEYMRLDPKDVDLNYRDTLSPEVTHLNNTLAVQKMMHSSDEWQPDWSQAPDDTTHWGVELGTAYWLKEEEVDGLFCKISKAPLFGYQGDWRDSLRERP